MKGANNTYWGNVGEATKSLWTGLKLSFRHILQATRFRTPDSVEEKAYFEQETGLVTLQYPHETFPIPDNGRYRLHNEIDDCIVCDKCAKICPVDCIEIDAIRAVEEMGKTSDGTPKRIHAAKFDIDMGKCCFCGLCTTVCPTECLTMTKAYDFSEYDVDDHVYSFATMTPLEILEKKEALEQFNNEKEKAKQAKLESKGDNGSSELPNKARSKASPITRPKPSTTVSEETPEDKQKDALKAAEKAKPKPRMKPAIPKKEDAVEESTTPSSEKTKPVFRPKVKARPKTATGKTGDNDTAEAKQKALELMRQKKDSAEAAEKAKPKPRMKPAIPKKEDAAEESTMPSSEKAKPVFRPKVKAKPKTATGKTGDNDTAEAKQKALELMRQKRDSTAATPSDSVKPKIKPKIPQQETMGSEEKEGTPAKSKPIFRPKVKTKPIIPSKKDEGDNLKKTNIEPSPPGKTATAKDHDVTSGNPAENSIEQDRTDSQQNEKKKTRPKPIIKKKDKED